MTGSGAGCGRDWPRCQGVFLPLEYGPATWLEYSHRALSGAALLLGIWLLLVAIRNRAALPFVLRFAAASFLFLLIEALIGAGTVLSGMTGENISVARGILVAFHLVNSLLLIGSLTLTVLHAYPGQSRPQFRRVHTGLRLSMLLGLAGMLFLMFSGGIAAMGNTMFPPETLQAGMAEDFNQEANLLIRLRIWHPTLAIGVGSYLWLTFGVSGWVKTDLRCRKYRRGLFLAYCSQILVGVANLALLGPAVLQILHLSLAILTFALWTAVTWLTLSEHVGCPVFPLTRSSQLEVGNL